MKLEILATGYCFLEAPRADGEGLWFSDLVLGGLYHWQSGRGVEHHLPDRRHIGGIAINEDGAIICSGPEGLAWFDPATGRSGTILDTIAGKRIGINDRLPDGRGGLIFGTLTTADGDPATAGANSLSFDHMYVTPEVAEAARLSGLALWPWAPDTAEESRTMLRLGVPGLMTNKPDVLNKVLQEFVS